MLIGYTLGIVIKKIQTYTYSHFQVTEKKLHVCNIITSTLRFYRFPYLVHVHFVLVFNTKKDIIDFSNICTQYRP